MMAWIAFKKEEEKSHTIHIPNIDLFIIIFFQPSIKSHYLVE